MCCAKHVALKYYILFINKELKTIHCNFVTELHNINEKPTKLQRKAQFHFKKQMPHSKCVMGKIYNAHYIKKESKRHLCQANITIQFELGLCVSQIVVAMTIFIVNSKVINDHARYFNFILGIHMNYFFLANSEWQIASKLLIL